MIGCVGALRLNERLLNAYWLILLGLLVGDVVVGGYWDGRTDTDPPVASVSPILIVTSRTTLPRLLVPNYFYKHTVAFAKMRTYRFSSLIRRMQMKEPVAAGLQFLRVMYEGAKL